MYADDIKFETSYGPAWLVYKRPSRHEIEKNICPKVSQLVVQCPEHIVWDSNGKWYPEPCVVDEVLPKARIVCQILSIPPWDWLTNVRRDDVWAIEEEFQRGRPIRTMMEYSDNPNKL